MTSGAPLIEAASHFLASDLRISSCSAAFAEPTHTWTTATLAGVCWKSSYPSWSAELQCASWQMAVISRLAVHSHLGSDSGEGSCLLTGAAAGAGFGAGFAAAEAPVGATAGGDMTSPASAPTSPSSSSPDSFSEGSGVGSLTGIGEGDNLPLRRGLLLLRGLLLRGLHEQRQSSHPAHA